MSGAPTISPSNRNVFSPPCMVVDRFGKLYYIDGLSRGLVWDQQWTTMQNLGIDKAPAPVVASDAAAGSLTMDGTYYCAVRYLDKNLQPGDLSEFDTVTGPAADASWRIDWTTITNSSDGRVLYVELWRSAAGVSGTVYLIVRLGNNGSIATITNTGGFCRVTTTTEHHLSAGAQITIAGASVAGYNTTHVVTSVSLSTVFDTDIAFTAGATTATWILTGYVNTDDDSDADLQANNESMELLNEDGTFYARRFGVPPTYKSAMIIFQDRAIYGVDVFYNAGTVSGSAGGGTLTGVGTNWTTDMSGRLLVIDGQQETFTVGTVASATSLSIDKNLVAALSGASYTITSPRDFLDTLIYSEQDEPESVPIDPVLGYVNTIKVQKNTSDIADRETGLMPLGGNFYSLRERHLYRINFTRQPDIDAAINLVASRGCVNNRCWAQLNEVAYLLDDVGIYSFTGSGGPKPLSPPIQDYWRDGTIDWTYKQWFFVSSDRQLGVVKFFVRLEDDGGTTHPRTAFCFHAATESWWIETYPWDVGHACNALIAGQVRMLVGSEDDVILKTQEGASDYGTPIGWAWKTGMFSFLVEPEQNTAEVELVFPPTETAGSITAAVFLDQRTTAQVSRADLKDPQNVATVAGTTGGVINTLRSRDNKGDAPGIARWRIGKRTDARAASGLYMQLQLSGTQTDDFISVYSVTIYGVQ